MARPWTAVLFLPPGKRREALWGADPEGDLGAVSAARLFRRLGAAGSLAVGAAGSAPLRRVPRLRPAHLPRSGSVLVLDGPHPLLAPATVRRLRSLRETAEADAAFPMVPASGGAEVHGGVGVYEAGYLRELLGRLGGGPGFPVGAFREALGSGRKIELGRLADAGEAVAVKDQASALEASALLNRQRVRRHQECGVVFQRPETVTLGKDVRLGRDTLVEGEVRLLGRTVTGPNCRIESGSVLQDTRLGRGVTVRASRITASHLGDGCDAGPFAHLRAGCRLAAGVHVGTNAELKNARVGRGSRIGHFCYVGDAELGRGVNVGAGCVFANYDGRRKHRTVVEDGAFLGSNSTLVAPVRIGRRALVAAGAVVTRNVPAGGAVAGVPAKPIVRRKRR